MRALTPDEAKVVVEKLVQYLGSNIKKLLERTDEKYVLRLSNKRVFYVREFLAAKATPIPKKNLISLGTCLGRFTKGGKFFLSITALPYLAHFCQYKAWVKASSELSFLHGNHVLKTGITRITEDTPERAGVVVFSMSNVPLGFGITARSTIQAQRALPTDVVVLNQSDIGEYLRDETKVV